jgi:hypothetical protein
LLGRYGFNSENKVKFEYLACNNYSMVVYCKLLCMLCKFTLEPV